jgi:hypothetical protein
MWRSLLWAGLLWHSPVWAKGAYEHALLIGVSQYADPAITELTGVPHDIESARQIATAMGIPSANISVLRDAQATKTNIVAALRRIGAAGSDGGRVLLYFSGHGTRWADPAAKGCVEGLLTYDREVIVNREWAELTRTVSQRADQLIVMFDACHSQGVTAGTRSLGGGMRPKFFMKAQEAGDLCSQPVNLRTRSLVQASHALGALNENVVHITSSRSNEVSFDEPGKGGLATQGVRDCLLGQAKDLDGSGAISLAEVEHCAQQVVRDKLKPHADLIPHHVSVAGFRNLVPVPVSPPPATVAQAPPNRPAANPGPSAEQVRAEKERLTRERREREAREAAERAEAQRQRQALEQAALQAQADERQRQREAERLRVERELAAAAEAEAAALQAAMAAQALASATPAAAAPATPVATPTPAAPPPEVSARATLRDLEQQRDRRQKVGVQLDQARLRIGQDFLNLQITAPHDGHVYLVMMGSDERSFYVLFPNGLDNNNRVRAGQTLRLPGPSWQLQAAGPAGTNELLVMVTRQPRALGGLQSDAASAGSPFVTAAADAEGRQRLQRALLGQGSAAANRFSAQRITVEEVQ